MCLCYSYLTSPCPRQRTIAAVFSKLVNPQMPLYCICRTIHKCIPQLNRNRSRVFHTYSVSFSLWTLHPSCQQQAVMLNYTYLVWQPCAVIDRCSGEIRDVQINWLLMSADLSFNTWQLNDSCFAAPNNRKPINIFWMTAPTLSGEQCGWLFWGRYRNMNGECSIINVISSPKKWLHPLMKHGHSCDWHHCARGMRLCDEAICKYVHRHRQVVKINGVGRVCSFLICIDKTVNNDCCDELFFVISRVTFGFLFLNSLFCQYHGYTGDT